MAQGWDYCLNSRFCHRRFQTATPPACIVSPLFMSFRQAAESSFFFEENCSAIFETCTYCCFLSCPSCGVNWRAFLLTMNGMLYDALQVCLICTRRRRRPLHFYLCVLHLNLFVLHLNMYVLHLNLYAHILFGLPPILCTVHWLSTRCLDNIVGLLGPWAFEPDVPNVVNHFDAFHCSGSMCGLWGQLPTDGRQQIHLQDVQSDVTIRWTRGTYDVLPTG